MSLCAKLVVQPAPRSIEFSNDPVTSTFPLPSHATPLPACVASPLPKCRDQRWPPVGESLARKMSTAALISAPPPKSIGPENAPVTAMLPLGSTATPFPEFENESPKPLDQRCAPAGENFATKMVLGPALVSAPVPKSIVPLNFPVTSTLPLPSTATARPVPPPSTPPRHFDHIVAHVARRAAEAARPRCAAG